jgi:hypothetical protein
MKMTTLLAAGLFVVCLAVTSLLPKQAKEGAPVH